MVAFLEQDASVAAPRGKLTTRAAWWAIERIRREHASVNGIRRQLGTGWRTVWESIRPLLGAAEAGPARFDDVTVLGVDEHIWHHVSTRPIGSGGRGPKELTGMVDLTRDVHGRTRARLLDLVPGRSGEAYRSWLHDRCPAFRDRVEIATLDPFRGYKNTIDDQLEDARAVLDAFHIVKLGTNVVDDVRRRVQQQMHGCRGRKGDPLYGIRNLLRAGEEHLTDRQRARLERAWQPTNATSRSRSPGTARSSCAPATTRPVIARAAHSPNGSSPRSRAVRSRKSRASDGHCGPGGVSSSATSTPKAATGGTVGRAPNSTSMLHSELIDRGLTSVPTPKRPAKAPGLSTIQQMLSNPYYKGDVIFRGACYDGLHEPLVSAELWYRVQNVLTAHQVSGEKTQTHEHYLKGSVYCGDCGSRLIVTHAKNGKGIVYPYFICAGRHSKRTNCVRQAMPIEHIERQVEDYYRRVQIPEHIITALRQMLVRQFDDLHVANKAAWHTLAVKRDKLRDERRSLLHAHHAGAVPLDLLKEAQDRIARRLLFLDAQIDAGQIEYDQAKAHLEALWRVTCTRST